MSKIIAVYGRPGSGKSTLAANLSCALATKNQVVILASANLDYGGIQTFFGESISEEQGIFAALADTAEQPQRMLTPCKNRENIFLLGVPNKMTEPCMEELYENRTKRLFQQLQVCSDYIVIDCTGYLREPMTSLGLFLADQILCTYTLSSESGLWHQAMQSFFERFHIKELVKPVIGQWNIGCSMHEFLQLYGLTDTVQLPAVEDAVVFQNSGKLIYEMKSKEAKQYRAVMEQLAEEVQ
ncbi:AAA family ATPase [Sinanaerobacter sp. ZZT-01]|uniref:AAA family ATPase n=1 Tax=Sinanaerobacter sp. ZZT-01 TaxID=3111540 RepID=UPI002D7941F8|nr:AAA family ATPase [Sinanaerobacter sp. ZZT-01]WRR94260.1 AAA family ATPase [Sinanaerobacter sp. ZZT-01]